MQILHVLAVGGMLIVSIHTYTLVYEDVKITQYYANLNDVAEKTFQKKLCAHLT